MDGEEETGHFFLFSSVLCSVLFYSKCTMALTFENFSETGEFQKVKDNILQVEFLTGVNLEPKT